ncbi:MAG TPA: sugar phosphate isomerase/epimerase [Herpetosiphonaceae bacterium]|nr:sugar phosphate isomerase/epimerase [Herpetosiphonaceae bacterium]
MRLGCNTVLFGGVDLATALTHIAWAGYQYVELAAIRGMCEHVNPDLGPEHRRDVQRLLAEHDLQATAIEAATTDRTRLQQLFGLATELGIPIVNIGSGGVTGDEESTKAAIDHLADLAQLAGTFGLRLAVKPHVGQAIYNSSTALRLVDEVRETALGLNFDPSHLFRAGENPEEVVRHWGAHIVTSHFRDCGSRQQQVGPPETQIPGRGIVDLPATFGALRHVGYAGPLNLEVIGAGKYELARAMGIAAESRGYLNRCLQEL